MEKLVSDGGKNWSSYKKLTIRILLLIKFFKTYIYIFFKIRINQYFEYIDYTISSNFFIEFSYILCYRVKYYSLLNYLFDNFLLEQ